jgi:two-component system, LytTR family, sensor kinase
MAHPVFRSPRTFIVYIGLWIMITLIHFSILYAFYGIPFIFAFTDSVVFNLIFCAIGIPLWYVVRYTAPHKQNYINLMFNHMGSLALMIAIWFGISYGLLVTIFSAEPGYITFIRASIPWRIISALFFYALLGLGYYLLITYNDLQIRLREESRLIELLKESELNMLKAQINPHFLFNSLNSVSSLTITNPAAAQEMVIRLSEFLRYTVNSDFHRFVPLKREVENISRYLEIEKVRFGDKLEFINDFGPECDEMMMPAMILQPLFENAIKHGVYESTGVIRIETTCKEEEKYIVIHMKNNFDPGAPLRKGAGVGLKNIRERLRLLYHQSDLLKTRIEQNTFFVELKIPLQGGEKHGS